MFSQSTLYCTIVDWPLTTQIKQWERNVVSVEQAFVGTDEKRAPLKTPAREATGNLAYSRIRLAETPH